MKLKILLLSMFFTGLLNAQVVCDYPEGVNTSLVITQKRLTSTAEAYFQLTNMGDTPIRLGEFKFGQLTWGSNVSWIYDLCLDPWFTTSDEYIFLPDRILDPGKSFVITTAYDYGPRHYKAGLGRLGGSERPKQVEIYEIADKLYHREELIDGDYYPEDSVTTALNDPEPLIRRNSDYSRVFRYINQNFTFYIEHHYTEGDSAVVDQIGGLFDSDQGKNRPSPPHDIAGISEGYSGHLLIRKAFIEKGNIDFDSGRGVSMEDSEWILIPYLAGYNSWRDLWWTVGNHGNYILDESTLESLSDAFSVDYANKKITVPWGTHRLDEIMRNMKKKPGVAWNYHLNPLQEDSLYRSARTGDQLIIYVVGNSLQTATFDIEVREPVADDNIVIPIDQKNNTGRVTTRAQSGILSWPRVTRHESGVDTITGSGFGLYFDMRTDTLLKYLEKPPKATWEFVWVDGQIRPDLKNGDQLKVTSESGKVKEYYIQLQSYRPNTNTDLAAITWPDIPEFYRGIFGWTGDTIPNFSAGTTIYRVTVPSDVEGIPALKATTAHVNATVKVTRAKSLTGTIEDRTVTFEVTAEDDTIQKKTYNVELVKEKFPHQIEPFVADPFISEFCNVLGGNAFVELYNPGNQPLDLRNYVIGLAKHTDMYNVVTKNSSWSKRYSAYVPGLKWVDEATWAITPRILIPDPNVNPIIPGGGTFVLANIAYAPNAPYAPRYDVSFENEKVPGHPNPWNEATSTGSTGGLPIPLNGNRGNGFYLFKILNDSVKFGLKPMGDPNDYEIIDVFAMANRAKWVIGGRQPIRNEIFIRKPHIIKGNPNWSGSLEGSFGTTPDDSEWIWIDWNIVFSHIPKPQRFVAAYGSLNQHYMIEPTVFKSTVNSSVYKVSQGFGPGEKIEGLKTGTTVAEFLGLIIKENEGQNLKVVAAADGSDLGMDAVISMNDALTVLSADSVNTTLYRLDVTETGLSSNAYLSSNRWNINVEVAPKSAGEAMDDNAGIGSVSGFDYGTTIKSVVDNVIVPAGATLTVIDGEGAYVPFTSLNFDTTYVSVTVNPGIYLDVVAEDGVTRIVYQLQPNTSASDAFILSDLYEVSQLDNLINYVPRGTNFQAFLANIIPSFGATLKLVDKMGFERLQGNIREDDKVVVTSANGLVTQVYFISFLSTETIPFTTYLAYVLSEAYAVDQVDYMITGGIAPLTALTQLSEFTSYITPSLGATAVVVDINGNEKTTGDLDDGDKLKVTSADGKIVVMYELDLDLTSAGTIGLQQIEIYPNPTTGKLTISGVETGNRVQIYSAAGALIRDMKARSNLEVLSIDDVPSGMFLIVISNDNKTLGRYKAIRK